MNVNHSVLTENEVSRNNKKQIWLPVQAYVYKEQPKVHKPGLFGNIIGPKSRNYKLIFELKVFKSNELRSLRLLLRFLSFTVDV